MGRRRSTNKPPPKKKTIVPLDKVFNCPFCNHGRSCEVTLHHVIINPNSSDEADHKQLMEIHGLSLEHSKQRDVNIGYIKCTICLEDFQTKINYLSQEIDVYNDWIDACEEANS